MCTATGPDSIDWACVRRRAVRAVPPLGPCLPPVPCRRPLSTAVAYFHTSSLHRQFIALERLLVTHPPTGGCAAETETHYLQISYN